MKRTRRRKTRSRELDTGGAKIVAKEITLVPTNKLKLWDDNPKRYSKSDISKLADLFKKHGVSSPIVAWSKNYVVYKGNKSLQAARLAGLKKVPTILRDFPSETAATAYGLADNKAGEWGQWDEDTLERLLSADDLQEVIEETGFSEDDIRDITEGWNYDPTAVGKVSENEKPLQSTITIQVAQEAKEDLLDDLEEFLEDYDAEVI